MSSRGCYEVNFVLASGEDTEGETNGLEEDILTHTRKHPLTQLHCVGLCPPADHQSDDNTG